MKVVLFCGGFGVRMGEDAGNLPKPMIRIGDRPILWHLMHYFAEWGHNEFILCLGHKGDVIKEYFLNFNEALLNDFRLERSGSDTRVELLNRNPANWSIVFADTGVHSTIAQRLKAVERYLGDDDEFLASYGDGLTDAPLDSMIQAFRSSGKTVQFLSVRAPISLHAVTADEAGIVRRVVDISQSEIRINGGFFVCRRELLDWIEPGDELVEQTMARLIEREEVCTYSYDGFFRPMDTMKDRQQLETLYESGAAPWWSTAATPEQEAAR
jgi:glucose-1-phosphate cytidylyltransferase